MSGPPDGLEPVRDPKLRPLDRELREIEFRERASFEAELRARLAGGRSTPHPAGRPARAAGAVIAALLIGLLVSGDADRTRPRASDMTRPVLIGPADVAGGSAGLHLAVGEHGRVLAVGARPLEPGSPDLLTLVSSSGGAAFVCSFDSDRARCGPPGALLDEERAPVVRGPFIYRDICCDRREFTGPREGVLTVTGLRDAVTYVFLYVDRNGDGRLTSGDRLRMRAHPQTDRIEPPRYANADRVAGNGMAVVAY